MIAIGTRVRATGVSGKPEGPIGSITRHIGSAGWYTIEWEGANRHRGPFLESWFVVLDVVAELALLDEGSAA